MACSRVCKATGLMPISLLLLPTFSVGRASAATPTPAPEGQTFSFPWPPEWVARGKYPKHVARGLSPEEAQQPGRLIGSGPWKLKEFKPHISIDYERNANYFKKGLPFFDGMVFTIVRDYNRRLAAMQVGQAHTTEGRTIGTYGNEDLMRL
jgi:ABC-type transport system substrate-binding protein